MAAAIVAERLTKDFQVGFWRRRSHRALDDLTIAIPFGEIFGLLGPNGAGKSTTLKLLLNLIWPTTGRVEVLGDRPGSVAARRRLGFLPENPRFYDHLTAEELLAYFAGLFGYRGEAARQRASVLLDQVGLGADRRRPLRQFSKGMLQRVGVAQALVNDPELVILDEPMSGLDPIGRREVRELILALRDAGRTIVFSSHVLSDAELLCSRVGILVNGRLVAQGGVSELTSQAAATDGGGWEVVISHLVAERVAELSRRVQRLTRIAENRYALEVSAGDRPERLIADLSAAGARLISVAPLGATLEDVFMAALHQNPVIREGRKVPEPCPSTLSARSWSTVSDVEPSTGSGRAEDIEGLNRRNSGTSARIRLVACHVFKEGLRDRVLYSIVAFGVILVAASLLVGQVTAGQDLKIVKDLGLATIELAGILMAVFIGVGLVAREIDRRSIYGLIAKPLPRWEFIVGKYIGLVLTILVNVGLMTTAFYAVLAYVGWLSPEQVRRSWEAPAMDPALLLAIALITGELALLTALALFFSTFSSSPLMSFVLTLGLWVVGLLSPDLRHFGEFSASPTVPVVQAIGWIAPAFSAFDIKTAVVHGRAVSGSLVAWRLLYGATYASVAVVGAIVIFSRREFR